MAKDSAQDTADSILRDNAGDHFRAAKGLIDLANGGNPPPGIADVMDSLASSAPEPVARSLHRAADKARGLNPTYRTL